MLVCLIGTANSVHPALWCWYHNARDVGSLLHRPCHTLGWWCPSYYFIAWCWRADCRAGTSLQVKTNVAYTEWPGLQWQIQEFVVEGMIPVLSSPVLLHTRGKVAPLNPARPRGPGSAISCLCQTLYAFWVKTSLLQGHMYSAIKHFQTKYPIYSCCFTLVFTAL